MSSLESVDGSPSSTSAVGMAGGGSTGAGDEGVPNCASAEFCSMKHMTVFNPESGMAAHHCPVCHQPLHGILCGKSWRDCRHIVDQSMIADLMGDDGPDAQRRKTDILPESILC